MMQNPSWGRSFRVRRWLLLCKSWSHCFGTRYQSLWSWRSCGERLQWRVAALTPLRRQQDGSGCCTGISGKTLQTLKVAAKTLLLTMTLRHALDFRLISGRRVLIIDGSHSIFGNDPQHASDDKEHLKTTTDRSLTLQPIPEFRRLLLEAIQEASSSKALGKVAQIDVGLICNARIVSVIAKPLHMKVLRRLKEVLVKPT